MKSNKSKKIKSINEKILIATMDIGKNIHYGYFRAPNGQDIQPFKFFNTMKSFNEFWNNLCLFKEKHGLEDVVIGFESTGPYAEPISNYLRKKPVQIVQVNPMHTKRVKELTGNSPHKTDKKDPRVIADVISLGHSLTVVVPEGAAAQLRRLSHARERALDRRTAMKNQLQHLVYVIFPEFLDTIDPSTKTGMYLLQHHSDPERIVSLGINKLKDIIRKVSRGNMSTDRAEELYKSAKETVGITEGKESILLETSHLVANIGNENRHIEAIEQQMSEQLEQIPYSHSIMSVKGIGLVTAAGLIGEVGDFNKFRTISEVMKLAGFDLFEVSSGKHKGSHHISKRGRSLIRKLLYFAAINAVKSHGIMHAKYQEMINKGKPKIKALVAISRKLLRIIFALARDNAVYDENYNSKHEFKLAA